MYTVHVCMHAGVHIMLISTVKCYFIVTSSHEYCTSIVRYNLTRGFLFLSQLSLSVRALDTIPPSILPHFKEAAQQLMKERGAEEALAAALAHISGSKEIVSRSVLSGMSVRG